jgi:hypothetical protein
VFKENLSGKIKNVIKWNGRDEITYTGNKEQVRKILLLHNVITMEKQINETARFSFFGYIGTKDKGWDIEHIQARAEKIPETEEHRKDWIAEIKNTIKENDNLKKKVDGFSDWANKEVFENLFEDVNQYFEDKSELDENTENSLSNLALLDAGTNRGYGNEFYPVKRMTILDKDKQGIFIPVCTKKIFLKYYTSETPNMSFWTKDDREAYLNDIKEKLSDYLEDK